MPRKRRPQYLKVTLPAWIVKLEATDPVLTDVLIEALFERWHAIHFGAEEHPKARSILLEGDQLLQGIKNDHSNRQAARKKSAAALRKYTRALDVAAI